MVEVRAPNLFETYEFSSATEALGARIFSSANLAWLKTLLSSYAEDSLKLVIDESGPEMFIRRHQELRAQIELLSFLVEQSEEANQQLNGVKEDA